MITYGPNNLLLNSATLSTQSVTVRAINYILSFKGTGTVTLSGASTAGPLVGTGVSDRVHLKIAPTAGSLTCTVSGSVTEAQLEAVTYQTVPRTYRPTTGAAYYGPRFEYDGTTPLGLLMEEARTNVVLHNRDLTNAAWVCVDATPLKDQTGVTGSTNSASSLIATGANATCLQAIVLASSARYQSAYVKRLSGSGTVEMTMDAGVTWTPITLTAAWTRVVIPTQTLANPTVGFRIVTSGDAIAIDGVQNENGAFSTSVIFTQASAIARSADTASISGANFTNIYNENEGTLFVEMSKRQVTNSCSIFHVDRSGTTDLIYIRDTASSVIDAVVRSVASAVTFDQTLFAPYVANAIVKMALAYKENDTNAAANGVAGTTDTAVDVPTGAAAPNQMFLGCNNTSGAINGHLKEIAYYNTRLDNATLASITT